MSGPEPYYDLEQSFAFCGIISGTARCANTKRPLTHSLDLSEEGLAMQATQKHASAPPAGLFDVQPSLLPELDGSLAEVTDLAAGTAAEHLVCADLLLQGHRAFMADQNCPYDIAVDLGRLIRIQVKSTRAQRNVPQRATQIPAYLFHVRRAGKGRRRLYGADDFDLLALVALDLRLVAYLPPSHHKMTIHIRPPGASGGKHFADYPFAKAVADLGLM